MPAPRLTKPDPALYKMEVTLIQHAYDLWPTASMEVRLTFTDDEVYTVARFERADTDLDNFPDLMRDLADGFLWGDGARNVVATVAREDHSRQSRRVRDAMPEG